ncbi:outer membrane lipoprotein carrier protein LolA, partial [bacterium]|nr:outer membrane lipoprotein carrier protein LolA [bacterium]MBU1917559.1 outer membrane lipoprotein carrier protein LolA [bacterium]
DNRDIVLSLAPFAGAIGNINKETFTMNKTFLINKLSISCFFLLCLLLLAPKGIASSDLAKDVESKYQQTESWQANFDQTTYVEILKQNLKKQGAISVKKPNKLRISYTSAPQKIYVSDGKKLWIYKENEKTARQFNKAKNIINKEALSFLGGLKNLSELFTVIEDLNEPKEYLKIKNKQLKQLHLIPQDKNSPVLKLTLGIDPHNTTIKEAVLFNASGNVTHYLFSNIIFDQKYPDNYFTLPKEPKRKIIKN